VFNKYPKEGVVAAFWENAENHAEKVGVITQFGTNTIIEVHDPMFIEKYAEFIPEKIDRLNPMYGPAKATLGMDSMVDGKTADKDYMNYRSKLMKTIGV